MSDSAIVGYPCAADLPDSCQEFEVARRDGAHDVSGEVRA